MAWTRKKPEVPDEQGDYMFKHRLVATPGAQALLNPADILAIIQGLRELVVKHDGIDYLKSSKMKKETGFGS